MTNTTHPLPIQTCFVDWGLQDYETIHALQKRLVAARLAGHIPNIVLLGEHASVITLGRGTHSKNLLHAAADSGLPVVEIERGGDVTYHGPGQLVVYPIMWLPPEQRDLHQFLRQLEAVMIQTLAGFNLPAERKPGATGVWVQAQSGIALQKIASIGVAFQKWVSYHGLALNVNTDLKAFEMMNPCGFHSSVMTSMQQLLIEQPSVSMPAVKQACLQAFAEVFDCTLEHLAFDAMLAQLS